MALISGSCHCGAVAFEISASPTWLTDCNCSLCRRIGGLWCHVDIEQVTITQKQNATIRYIQGDKQLAVHTCRNCGCTTHWENLHPEKFSHMAVNFRMCSIEEFSRYRVRHFDGANTWEYLD